MESGGESIVDFGLGLFHLLDAVRKLCGVEIIFVHVVAVG